MVGKYRQIQRERIEREEREEHERQWNSLTPEQQQAMIKINEVFQNFAIEYQKVCSKIVENIRLKMREIYED
jgi:hypothetical protein